MLRLDAILGLATDEDMRERLHALGHRGAVETVRLERGDMRRRRLRTTGDRGTDCAIALPRDVRLEDGAVLLIEDDRAIVVRAVEERWLPLRPRDAAAALELGYRAGNLHWRVRFRDGLLEVALEGPERAYLDRLADLLDDGRCARGR